MRPYPDKHFESIRAYLLMRQNAIKGRAELERLEAQVAQTRAEVMLAGATQRDIDNVRDRLVIAGRLPRSAGGPSERNRYLNAKELLIELCLKGKPLQEAMTAAQTRTGYRFKRKQAYNLAYNAGVRLRQHQPLANADLLHSLYYRQGLTYTQIGAAVHCSASTVKRWMRRHGFDARNTLFPKGKKPATRK